MRALSTSPGIQYAQCWEDPRTLLQGLNITEEDEVLSIASAGDNTFAILLENPRSVVAVDRDPAQIYLVELKLLALQRLEYRDFVGFLGASPCNKRKRLYQALRGDLSSGARGFWEAHLDEIERGVIHAGRFETYFSVFRRYLLPLIHRRRDIDRLLSASTPDGQRVVYDQVWDNWRWRALFRLFFSRAVLGALGRGHAKFRYVETHHVARELFLRARHGLRDIPARDNPFVEYILTGAFSDLSRAHPYLQESNFEILRRRTQRLTLACADLREFLAGCPEGRFSRFNLSDVFEYVSDEEYQKLLGQIMRVAKPGSLLAFWTLFLPREVPPALSGTVEPDRNRSDLLHRQSRTFFYGSFELLSSRADAQMESGCVSVLGSGLPCTH